MTEQLGIVLVYLPRPHDKYSVLVEAGIRPLYNFRIMGLDRVRDVLDRAYRCTKSEADERFPKFRWVSLEELEKEG